MAGDLPIQERLIITGGAGARSAEADEQGRAVPDVYGDRVRIIEVEEGAAERSQAAPPADAPSLDGLSEVEALGAAAFQIRQSEVCWEAGTGTGKGRGTPGPAAPGGCAAIEAPSTERAGAPAGAPPTSAFLEGSVAVGIVIVAGPGGLQFSNAERTKIVAEVQNGLSYFAATNPKAGLTFTYDIRFVQLNVAPDPRAAHLEAVCVIRPWRRWASRRTGRVSGSTSRVSAGPSGRDGRIAASSRSTPSAGSVRFLRRTPDRHGLQQRRVGSRQHRSGLRARDGPHFRSPRRIRGQRLQLRRGVGPTRQAEHQLPELRPGRRHHVPHERQRLDDVPGHTRAPRVDPRPHIRQAQPQSPGHHRSIRRQRRRSHPMGLPRRSNQRSEPDHIGGGFYRLVRLNSGKVLDVTSASTANGAAVIQWDWHGGDNQLFRIVPLGDGVCPIVAKHSGRVLDVTGAAAGNGARIIQWDWHGGDNQHFLLTACRCSQRQRRGPRRHGRVNCGRG